MLTTAARTRLTASTIGVWRRFQSRLTGRTDGPAAGAGTETTVGSWPKTGALRQVQAAVRATAANADKGAGGCILMSPHGVQTQGLPTAGCLRTPLALARPSGARVPILTTREPVTGVSVIHFDRAADRAERG